MAAYRQLLSYIAHSAPATRRPAAGDEPSLRPEIGFVPRWFHRRLGIDFGESWHTNPEYRRQTIMAMATETKRLFGGRCDIGILQSPEDPADILTGTFGALLVAGIYGIPIRYGSDEWPWAEPGHELTDQEADNLEPPDLDDNEFWLRFMSQLDWIADNVGPIEGFMNWQGVLNNAFRLRGQRIFIDMVRAPDRVFHIFECVTTTMIEGVRELYRRQRQTGVRLVHYTISNCLVNMLSPQQYETFQLPFDMEIAKSFEMIGVHNCAWTADPYLDLYAKLPNVAYIDMGKESDLPRARRLFPEARRAIMYSPEEIKNKPLNGIRADFERIASQYGPCDIVLADIEDDTPDDKVLAVIEICRKISTRNSQCEELDRS